MGKFYETIPPSLQSWILDQKVFYIASAPLSGSGHVNVSPKGGQYFGLLDDHTFYYQDLSGSGIETTSHLHERGNGRITVMFNAFEGPPRILRLWGKGRALEYGTSEFEAFVREKAVKTIPGTRSIIVVDVHQVGTSCGFSMPFFDFRGFRTTLNEFFVKRAKADEEGKTEDGIERYWAFKNQESMDGLPGLKRGVKNAKTLKVAPMKKMEGPYAPTAPRQASRGVPTEMVLLLAIWCFFLGILVTIWAPSLLQSWEDRRTLMAQVQKSFAGRLVLPSPR